jgi:hypothetical protein
MALGIPVLKILSKQYQPDSKIDRVFKSYDLTFVTNEEGNPIQLFIGKRKPDGNIKGDRYSRVLKKDESGKIIKDHWDLKGKAY